MFFQVHIKDFTKLAYKRCNICAREFNGRLDLEKEMKCRTRSERVTIVVLRKIQNEKLNAVIHLI